MIQKFKGLLILAVSGLVIGTSSGVVSKAQAQFYVSGNAGVFTLMDSDTTSTARNGTGSLTGDSSFDTGYVLTGAVGYSMGTLKSRRRDLPSKKRLGSIYRSGFKTCYGG